MTIERVVLASPRGFCAGVIRAIATVEHGLAALGSPIYVRRTIVHNADVVSRLAATGAVFVDDLNDVPEGAVVVLGAHGVARSVRDHAALRSLRVVDATCPLVAKVHAEARRYARRGFDVVLIGHAGHDEVIATLGQSDRIQLVERVSDVARLRVRRPGRVACLTQTTLRQEDVAPIVAALRCRFPELVQPRADDICYATRHRQAAVEWLARVVDVVLIVGDPASSNSNRLVEAAAAMGTRSHLIAAATDIRQEWLTDARVVGVSAGASSPEHLVSATVAHLRRSGAALEEVTFLDERVTFRLPPEVLAAPLVAGPVLGGPVRPPGARVADVSTRPPAGASGASSGGG